VQATLLEFPFELLLHPQAILDHQMINRNNQAATQMLIHWKGLTPTKATWEFVDELALRFSQFNLGDKVHLKEGQLLQVWNQERKDTKKIGQ